MDKHIVLMVATIGLLAVATITGPQLLSVEYQGATSLSGETPETIASLPEPEPVDVREVVEHVPLPEQVKAIYMSACVAGTPSFRHQLVKLAQETEINSILIDIKDFSGTIAFPPPTDSIWNGAWQNAECGARDMKELIQMMHDNDIFVIGRITVFQDPYLASVRPDLAVKRADGETVWNDYKGLSFIDVGAREYWDYVVELTKLSYNLGFDEINYDYIRYPSDGNMQDITFAHSGTKAKAKNLEEFFQYLHSQIQDPELYADVRHENTGREQPIPYTSADLFGFTTSNQDDLSIGQIIERAFPYFDFIAPMVYPSHYPDGHLGYEDPNLYPYEVVYNAMKRGVERAEAETTQQFSFAHERIGTSTPPIYKKPVYSARNLRTWIQDFDYGGDYDAADVRAQFQASYDAGVMDWMIWAPSNIYTREALFGPGHSELSTIATSTTR
ncbi:MAG: putative glycoside hydrolase [Patescibacteria group bacterium]